MNAKLQKPVCTMMDLIFGDGEQRWRVILNLFASVSSIFSWTRWARPFFLRAFFQISHCTRGVLTFGAPECWKVVKMLSPRRRQMISKNRRKLSPFQRQMQLRPFCSMILGEVGFKPSPIHFVRHVSFSGDCGGDPGFNLMLACWHHEKCLLFLSNGRAEGLQKRQ